MICVFEIGREFTWKATDYYVNVAGKLLRNSANARNNGASRTVFFMYFGQQVEPGRDGTERDEGAYCLVA